VSCIHCCAKPISAVLWSVQGTCVRLRGGTKRARRTTPTRCTMPSGRRHPPERCRPNGRIGAHTRTAGTDRGTRLHRAHTHAHTFSRAYSRTHAQARACAPGGRTAVAHTRGRSVLTVRPTGTGPTGPHTTSMAHSLVWRTGGQREGVRRADRVAQPAAAAARVDGEHCRQPSPH
jgi:hypothetical protein